MLESIGLLVHENKFKIDFKDGGNGGLIGLLIQKIFAIFDLQVVLIFPTKFRVKWHFHSETEKQIFKMAAILDFRSK